MRKLLLSLVLISATTVFADELRNRVEYLTPPRIEQETIAKEICCVRPMRDGMPNISSEQIDEKFVVNCYGHGGSGWTTLFGSVKEAIALLQIQYPTPAKTPSIRVIGAGCMGLNVAIELASLGYSVAGISTKDTYDTPSWKAGGYYGIFALKVSPEEQDMLNRINSFTFETYRQIEDGNHPYLSSDTVRYLPTYSGPGTPTGVEELVEMGLIPPQEVVDIDFGNGVMHKNFVKAMSYYFDVIAIMQQMKAEVDHRHIPIELKEIHHISEVSEAVVFNCAGLGGKVLANNDGQRMIPVRGHLLLLNERGGQGHMDYMIGDTVLQQGNLEDIYFIPKSSYVIGKDGETSPIRGVLGGTFIDIENLTAEELQKLDEIEFKKLYERVRQFYYGP